MLKETICQLLSLADVVSYEGEFHDQGDAKWIVIRGKLRGNNDTPFGRPTFGLIWWFFLLLFMLVIFFF